MWWGDVFKALQVVAAAALWRSTMKPSGALAGLLIAGCRRPNGVVYKTRTEATNAMRTVKVCHED